MQRRELRQMVKKGATWHEIVSVVPNGGNYRKKEPQAKRGITMRVNEIKHQANLEKWKQNILDCRMSGLTVQQWCSEYGCNKATYYRWEREIFKKTDTLVPVTASTNAAVTLSGQPEFAELPIAASGPLALQEAIRPSRFESVAIIRVGKVELELSNSVSEKLMRQLKGLMSLAE